MITIKHIFSVVLLITSYNASGMFGMGRQLTQNPSRTEQERLSYDYLGLMHLKGEHQQEYFYYSNSGKYNHPRFKELLVMAQFNQAATKNAKNEFK